MLTVAPPRPGKCLRVAPTCSRACASTAAVANRATSADPPGKARPASTDAGSEATSTTGARLTLTPAARRSRAPSRAAAPAASTLPSVAGLASGAAKGRLRISPPSWSVATSADPRAARWSSRVSASRLSASTTLGPNRITPAPSLRASRRRMYSGTLGPSKAITSSCPTWASSGSRAASPRACWRARSGAGSSSTGPPPPPPAPAAMPASSATAATAPSAARRRRAARSREIRTESRLLRGRQRTSRSVSRPGAARRRAGSSPPPTGSPSRGGACPTDRA